MGKKHMLVLSQELRQYIVHTNKVMQGQNTIRYEYILQNIVISIHNINIR